MSVGALPLEDEELPGGPPVPPQPAPVVPPPDPMVMSPVGPVPASVIPGGVPPDVAAPPPDASALPPPGAPPPTGQAQPAVPMPPAEAAPLLPPKPQRPPLTGDPAKDMEASLGYERSLDDWHTQTLGALAKQQNDVRTQQAQKELQATQEEETKRQEERARQQQAREAYQKELISSAVNQRAAQQDLESGKWRGNPSSGRNIMALIIGGIGAGLSAAGGHPTGNLAAQAIDDRMNREYKAATDKVQFANEHALQLQHGYNNLLDNQRASLNDIDADFAAKHKLIAAEAEAQLRLHGASPEQIQTNEIVTGNLQKSAQYEDQIHARELEYQRKQELDQSTIARNNAQAESAQALAGYRKGRTHVPGAGGGTGGGSKAIDAMNAAAKAGGAVGDIEMAGVKAGMSRKEALAQAKAMTAGHGKGGGGAGGGDQSLVVRDVDGNPIGMAPSTRNVKQIEDRFVNYDQAIKSLKSLYADGNFIPRGAKWDNAVLAIASTTTAGATDTNVAHEAGTLKDAIGTVGGQAIRDKIDDLERRQAQFKKTLRPLPSGFKVDQGEAQPRPRMDGGPLGQLEQADDGKWYPVKK